MQNGFFSNISLVNEEITGRAIHRTFARVIAYLTCVIEQIKSHVQIILGRARAITCARMTRL